MAIDYLTDIPTGNHFAFGMIEEQKEPPVLVGEEWVTVESVTVTSLPPGLYAVNGAVVYKAGSTNKNNLFRLVLFDVEQPAVVVQLTDTEEVLYMPFRTFVNVKNGFIKAEIQAQQVGGGGAENLEVISTHLDYEKKSDLFSISAESAEANASKTVKGNNGVIE